MKDEVLSALTVIGPMSRPELERYLGLARTTVYTDVRILRAAKAIHISAWERPGVRGGGWTPVYAAGGKPDVAKPPPLTPAEHMRIYRKRHNAITNARQNKKLATPFDGLLKK